MKHGMVLAAFSFLAGPTLAADADLLTFCLAAPPDAVSSRGALYAAECPAFLQSQFSSSAAATLSGSSTTQLAQQQAQSTLDTNLIMYQMMKLDGTLELAGFKVDNWVDTKKMNN